MERRGCRLGIGPSNLEGVVRLWIEERRKGIHTAVAQGDEERDTGDECGDEHDELTMIIDSN